MKVYKLLSLVISIPFFTFISLNALAEEEIYCPEKVVCQGSVFSDCQTVPSADENYEWYPKLAFHVSQGTYYFNHAQADLSGLAFCIYCKESDSSCRDEHVIYSLTTTLWPGTQVATMVSNTKFLLPNGSYAWSSVSGICNGADSSANNGGVNPLNCPFEVGQ